MLIIIKSPPDTPEAKRAVKLAMDMAADIVLLQDAAYLAQTDKLQGFCGTAFVVGEDRRLRGIGDIGKGVKEIGYDELVDLMAGNENVAGMF
jgi:sulfur relay protein TusB/DsrH